MVTRASSGNATSPPLAARSLAFGYDPRVPVLRDVSLAVEYGELVALIGPNGAGKSTLVRLLSGIFRPWEGEVSIGDESMRRVAVRDRAREIAVVPQELGIPGDVTVERFVEGGRYAHLGFWRRHAPEDRDAIDAALESTELTDLRERRLSEMSSGQRQRVLMARAMSQQARILLVDEPTASLDATHQIRAFEMILGLVRQGHAALVITHELNLASQFASRVLVLDDGVIAAEGSPADVFRPEIIEPVYGPDLHYGELPSGVWGEPRPFLVPWRQG